VQSHQNRSFQRHLNVIYSDGWWLAGTGSNVRSINNQKRDDEMKKTYLAVAIAAAFAAQGVVHAQDYQMEAGLSYVDFDGDETVIGLDFTYHFETVSTNGRPLAESAFLGRNSNVSATYATFDEADVDAFSVGVEYWFDDIYTSAEYTDIDGDGDYELRLGYMLDDGFLVYLGLNDGDSYVDKSDLVFGTKYVAKMGDNFVNLQAELTTNDGDNFVDLTADYFFTNEFSAGIRVSESDLDGDKTEFGIGARYFFTPTISGEVEYSTKDSADTIGLRVAARF